MGPLIAQSASWEHVGRETLVPGESIALFHRPVASKLRMQSHHTDTLRPIQVQFCCLDADKEQTSSNATLPKRRSPPVWVPFNTGPAGKNPWPFPPIYQTGLVKALFRRALGILLYIDLLLC
jgi:hypothetical protein